MRVEAFKCMKGGWFVGGFTPTVFHTWDVEVAYKRHARGDYWPPHYHRIATVRGSPQHRNDILLRRDLNTVGRQLPERHSEVTHQLRVVGQGNRTTLILPRIECLAESPLDFASFVEELELLFSGSLN